MIHYCNSKNTTMQITTYAFFTLQYIKGWADEKPIRRPVQQIMVYSFIILFTQITTSYQLSIITVVTLKYLVSFTQPIFIKYLHT